ncbi:MAG: methionyl-tRNA formyltransferase [Clostridia bacterium]|nr:methionyl-tRNA formyltransferase [Clostridia bacterium]
MKIIFLGSPEFAIKPLEALINSGHEILAVVTQPDSEAGRGQKQVPCPLKVYALERGLKVLSFEKISRDGVKELKDLKPDIMVTCAYGQILSQEIIDIARLGIINVHGSILPKYRGASPIQSAIINGETETGITIMQTEAGLDCGDILKVKKTLIYDNETAGELTARLSSIGAEALVETISDFENNTISRIKQVHTDATFTTKLTKLGSTINFNKTATQINNLIRGSNPSPVARAFINGQMLKIYRARVREDLETTEKPGTIIYPTSAKQGVFVACGVGVLELLSVQLPSGKEVEAKTLVSGRKLMEGMVFSDYSSTIVNNGANL